jgi:hypothetical protein
MICAEQTQFLGLRRKNLIERLFVGFEQVVKTYRAARRVEIRHRVISRRPQDAYRV